MRPTEKAPFPEGRDDPEKAWNQALYYLKFRDRSRVEMERYLTSKGFSDAAVAQALGRLDNAGWLDDAAFARRWVEVRTQAKPKGRTALRAELMAKGLADEDIGPAIAALDEPVAARAALRPRLRRWQHLTKPEFIQKAAGFLARRGFPPGLCLETSKQAWAEMNETENPACL